MTTSDNKWHIELQLMTASKRVILSFKMKQKGQYGSWRIYSIFYEMYIYYIFNNIDNIVGKLLAYVCTVFFVSIMEAFLHFFCLNFAEVS